MSDDSLPESFEAFRKSFFYGSRSDLNFKFLKSLTDAEAAEFFQGLLWKLGDAIDDGDASRLIAHVAEWQVRGYQRVEEHVYTDGPFTLLQKPVAESRLTLITSSGPFAEGHDPEPFGVRQMTQGEATARIQDFIKAAPQLSAIPFDTPADELRVRHGGYDIRGAQRDPNVVLPLGPLASLRKEGVIGELTPDAYSFVGATAQTELLKETGPEWVAMLARQHVDATLLVPV